MLRHIYWENGTRFSDIVDIMSRNRFETLPHYFHFTNSLEVSDEKKRSAKLWKLDPWLCAQVSAEEF